MHTLTGTSMSTQLDREGFCHLGAGMYFHDVFTYVLTYLLMYRLVLVSKFTYIQDPVCHGIYEKSRGIQG